MSSAWDAYIADYSAADYSAAMMGGAAALLAGAVVGGLLAPRETTAPSKVPVPA